MRGTMWGTAVALVIVVAALLPAQPIPRLSIVHAETSATSDATAKEKLPAFLTQVLQIDLTKYNITTQNYIVRYPSQFGGTVKEDTEGYVLECNDSVTHVTGIFDNGLISWLNFSPLNGSIILSNLSSADALVEAKAIFERYLAYCQEFNLDAAHIRTILAMLNNVPPSPANSGFTTNFNGMSDFTSANITSDNVMLEVSESYIRASCIVNGIVIRNKCVFMSIGPHSFIFDDTWNLYHVGNFSAITQEEAQAIALDAAKNLMAAQPLGTDHGPELVNVTWSSRVDAGMLMIPGQSHNNTDMPIPPPDNFYNGNVTRDPLGLYPLWQFVFYFNQTYGNICGVQVAVWGDTREIAYCNTYGFLGTWLPSSTPIQESTDNSTQTSKPTDNSTSVLPTDSPKPVSEEPFPWLPVAAVSVAVAAAAAVAVVVYVKKHKRGKLA